MRRMLILAVLAVLGAAAAAPAQTGNKLSLQFVSNGDTVIGAVSGANFSVTVQSGYDGTGWGPDSFALRFPFDATRLAFVGATKLCPDSTVPLNTSVVGNVLTVSTQSCNGVSYGQSLFQLTFQLFGGTVDGTWLTMLPVAVLDNGGNNRLADANGDVAQVCHASGVWGDVSNDGVVNSLDALITLSGAVGLSTGPYSLANADVDGDGQVTSRDALGMLSASIGLPTGGFRVGNGIVDRCARQVTLPRPLYFSRGGFDPGLAGVSGLTVRAANDSSVIIAGDSSDVTLNYQWRPRVSPDGSHVLFVCLNSSYYPNICKANADGSSPVVITTGFAVDQSPDWSPDGSRIVFVRSNTIWVMDSAGGNQAPAIGSPPLGGVTSVAWQPSAGSLFLAYTNSSGGLHTTNVDAVGADVTVLSLPCCGPANQPRFIDWNTPGDSVVFDLYVDGYSTIAAAAAAAGATLDIRIAMTGPAEQPVWTDQGILFVTPHGPYRMFLQRPDGSIVQVRSDNNDNFLPGMRRQ